MISYLKQARKATGKLKFGFYDLEMSYSTQGQDENFGKDRDLCFHFGNIISLLNRFPCGKGREVLRGMPAEIAGRIVFSRILGSSDSTPDTHKEITAKCDQLIEKTLREGSIKCEPTDAVFDAFERNKQFIACLKEL